MTTGTSVRPSVFAAFSLVWPVTTTPSEVMTIGTLKPNSLIEAATAGTAASFCLGFFSYGLSSSIFL